MNRWGIERANHRTPRNMRLASAISTVLLGVTAGGSAFGQAAAPATEELEEVVVSGIRESLEKALDIKRESIQLVDAIVAEDIGKFPDNNVVEALQRVPGVQVTDRANGEAGKVSIRGLDDVTTTVNGRNVFTASGRQIALADVPANLINRVDVFKTRSADLIEAGIAGVIDIQTQRPFNFPESKVSLSVRGIYQEQSEELDPNVSALFSDRWTTGIGEVGALLNVSYAQTNYRGQSFTAGAQMPFATDDPPANLGAYQIIRSVYNQGGPEDWAVAPQYWGVENWQPGLLNGLPTAPGSTMVVGGEEAEYILSRDAVFASDLTGERERPAANISLQWAPNDSSEYVLDVFYNGYRNQQFNSLMFTFVDFWGSPQNANIVLYPGTNIVKSRNTDVPFGFTSGDLFTAKTDSFLYALGGKWNVSDAFELRADVAWQTSEYEEDFIAMRGVRVAPGLSIDFNAGDGIPALTFNDNPGTADIDESDLTDPRLWNLGEFYDNAGWREGDAATVTIDGDYHMDSAFLTTLSFGVRYDDRSASEGTRGQSAGWLAGLGSGTTMANFPDLVSTNSGFFDGQATVPGGWAAIDGYYLRSHADQMRNLYNTTLNIDLAVGDELVTPKNFEVNEVTSAAYLQANFDVDVAGHQFDGQLGARYVSVDTDMDFWEGPANARVRTSDSATKSKLLPSVMMRFAFTDELRLRASYGETLRRPNFIDLNPVVRYARDVSNIGYGTANGGNPDLEPTESKNYDLSLEWYFSNASAVYVTAFKREIEGFVVPFLRRVNYTDDIGPYDYILAQPYNASNGELDGVEFGFQYFPENVPNWLNGIGLQASYTMLDSQQDTPITNSAGEITGTQRTSLFGVSDSSYSAVLVYEKDNFDARLSWVWREDFLNNYEAALFANPKEVWRASEQNLDFQLSYDLTDALVLTFDATNLTDEIYQSYYVNPTTNNFGSAIVGRTFALGARFTF
ncbi:TonB-dependent receptor [Povalibacter uvarum]|uniref:TonB-dependent receptor n=1 Tax=Povalibacter uvarum TaxID=732238 RepID=A0A841HQ05_9GAMM|nr:TonB-dependent receptor [Povalibacter uvarum]MBB6095421.1 TonB-dependent receptor [Povalibacter uvarum]